MAYVTVTNDMTVTTKGVIVRDDTVKDVNTQPRRETAVGKLRAQARFLREKANVIDELANIFELHVPIGSKLEEQFWRLDIGRNDR